VLGGDSATSAGQCHLCIVPLCLCAHLRPSALPLDHRYAGDADLLTALKKIKLYEHGAEYLLF